MAQIGTAVNVRVYRFFHKGIQRGFAIFGDLVETNHVPIVGFKGRRDFGFESIYRKIHRTGRVLNFDWM